MVEGWDQTSEAFRRYLLTRGRTPDTATTYSAHVRPFWAWCSGDVVGASRDAVERYHEDQLSRFAASTAHVRLSALKAFYRWLGETGRRGDNPTDGLTVRKEKRQPRPPLSEDAILRLLMYTRNEEERMLFVVGLNCGLRISEIVGIRGVDIYADRGLILIKGKGRKERWVGADPEVLAEVCRFAGGRKSRLFDFDRRQARRIMERIAKYAGVEGFYPHRMRITFAVRFWAKYKNLKALRMIMGHEDLATTAHYADWDTQNEAIDLMRTFSLT